MKRLSTVGTCSLLFLCAGSLRASAARPVAPENGKQVVASADDVRSGLLRLPDPRTVLHRSRTAWYPIDPGAGRVELTVPVDAGGALSIVAISADIERWTLGLRGGTTQAMPLASLAQAGLAERSSSILGGPLTGANAERFDVAHVEPGPWTLVVDALPGARGGLIGIASSGSLRLAAHLTSYELFDDGAAGVAAFVYDATDPETAPAPGASLRATLELEVDGARWKLAMLDDGQGLDEAAGDGVYTAALPHGVTGDVGARVHAIGRTTSGYPFARDALLAFPMRERVAAFTDTVQEGLTESGALKITLGVASELPDARVHASTELWGVGSNGAQVPIAWLSRIGELEAGGFSFEIDAALLAAADAAPPLELRAVRLQDPHTHLPYDRVARHALTGAPLATPTKAKESTATSLGVAQTAQFPRGLLLVHGYCSSGVWPPADFTPPFFEFLDVNQNRTHDEFAQLLLDFGSELVSFGVVAHSQGGMAAVHLLTYYSSGLDHAAGGRRIQSVGSPYQGTPLAPLGDIIPGVGCGANFDMSPDGAALWLAGIPSSSRAAVHYYTTSETSFFACNVLTDFLLDDPNDGVVEFAAAQLSGANSEGHTSGWCHTTGMAQSAQYTDHARNVLMDAAASH